MHQVALKDFLAPALCSLHNCSLCFHRQFLSVYVSNLLFFFCHYSLLITVILVSPNLFHWWDLLIISISEERQGNAALIGLQQTSLLSGPNTQYQHAFFIWMALKNFASTLKISCTTITPSSSQGSSLICIEC